MADFDLTRAEAKAGIHVDLLSFKYHAVIGAWSHESGAWLTLENVQNFPSVYVLIWRAVPYWRSDKFATVYAFEEADPDVAWARAMECAAKQWERGQRGEVLAQAEISLAKKGIAKSGAGTKGGQKSGEARAKLAEERAAALELAKKFRIPHLPEYDAKVWRFNPIRDTNENPIINFTHKKFPDVYAALGLNPTFTAWELRRGWKPGMNDDNAPIDELCIPAIGEENSPTDIAFVTLAKLLKTDPARWLRGDYIHFAP